MRSIMDDRIVDDRHAIEQRSNALNHPIENGKYDDIDTCPGEELGDRHAPSLRAGAMTTIGNAGVEVCETSEMLVYLNWGKRGRDDGSTKYHLLVYHLLDVAAVTKILLESDTLLRSRLAELIGMGEDNVQRLISFLSSIHDIGKISNKFQYMDGQGPALRGHRPIGGYEIRHTELGLALWDREVERLVQLLFLDIAGDADPYDQEDAVRELYTCSTCHHGRPHEAVQDYRTMVGRHFTEEDLQMVDATVDAMAAFLLQGPCVEWNDWTLNGVKEASWLIAGTIVLSDWLGSNEDFFPLEHEVMPLDIYWGRAIEQAKEALGDSGVLPVPPVVNQSFNDMFPGLLPTPLQSHCWGAPLPEAPTLYIVEDCTGSGKTEAALSLVKTVIEADMASGMFIALPTMATSNQLFERVHAIGERILHSDASIRLAHGKAKYYMESRDKGLQSRRSQRPGEHWLSQGTRRAILANIGVGTIDQALMAALPLRWQSLRLLGLSRSVIVIDEVHAYDAYTLSIVQSFLSFCSMLGITVVAMSATLPIRTRRALLSAYGGVQLRNVPLTMSYPMVTTASMCCFSEAPVDHSPRSERSIGVLHETSESSIVRMIRDWAEEGKRVCWFRNTIDDAIDGFMKVGSGPFDTLLIHSRFTLGDRLHREGKIISLCSKDAPRDGGMAVVSTQVLEQSLDIEFDIAVSDLAPIDSILQRMGRVQRFAKGSDATLVIHGPPDIDEPHKGWYSDKFPRGAYVYTDHALLWLTQRALVEKGRVVFPFDNRDMVEHVYSDESWRDIPPALEDSHIKTWGKSMSEICIADMNVLRPADGYGGQMDAGRWDSDVRTPTRLGDSGREYLLIKEEDGALRPWNIGLPIENSIIRVPQACSRDRCDEDQIRRKVNAAVPEAARLGPYVAPLVLSQQERGWAGLLRHRDGQLVFVTYDDFGLRIMEVCDDVQSD